ncbi:alpha/beta fold hydrolase [Corynebacterium heidelbergense]|nr:alpha/beta fold hydrolase [Corynebacterium heidelbergense]
MPQLVPVPMPDGSRSPIRLWDATTTAPAEPAPGEPAAPPSRPLVMIWPGWGMGARYYDPIATELAGRGFPVAIGELRGQGGSTAVPSRTHRWGYHHMASEDYPLSIRAAKRELGLPVDHPTILLCHSMGGQIGFLFLSRPEAAELGVIGLMGVGSGTPCYRGFTGRARWRLFIGSYLMRAVAMSVGYQPNGPLDVAGYGRQSGDHVIEWTHYVHNNDLSDLRHSDRDYVAAQREVLIPVLLTRCSNDDDCPLESARNLAQALPNAPVEVEEIAEPLGHNRWAREPDVVATRCAQFAEACLRDAT